MKKTFSRLVLILTILLIIPYMIGCNDNRPTFPVQNTDNNSSSSSSNIELNTITLTIDDNIIISSTSNMTKNSNKVIVNTGSLIKIKLDLAKLTSTNNESFYFDETTNSIVSGIKFNNEILPLSNLNQYFTVWNDANISLISSKLNLCSILICEDYNSDESNKLYNKFNYKSNNFRNSLINIEDNCLNINNSSINYITLNQDNLNLNNSNVSHSSNYLLDNKTLSMKIETFYETTEISFVFVYKDELNNLFLSEVNKINEFALNSNDNKSFNFSVYDNNINFVNLEFVKYYLQNAV